MVIVSMCTTRINTVDEFFLQGTQMNFIQRSQPKDSKNSHNSIMSSRPCSAAIDRRLYKKENSVAKRPLSADTIFCNEKNTSNGRYQNINSTQFRDSLLPIKDNMAEVSNLPSSQILKSLLSEPLDRAWNKAEKDLTHFDTTSVDSIIESEKSLGARIQEFVEERAAIERGALLPGLKTKPPIPDKSKPKIDQFHNIEMNHSFHLNLIDDNELENKYERFGNGKIYESGYMINATEQIIDGKYARDSGGNENCYLEDLEDFDKSIHLDSAKDTLDIDLRNEENLSNTSFKNWLQENNGLLSETNVFEIQTDLEFQNLQKQQENLTNNYLKIDTIEVLDFETNKNYTSSPESQGSTTRRENHKNKIDPIDKSNKIIKNNKMTNKLNNQKNNQIKTPKEINKKPPKSILKPGNKTKRDSGQETNSKTQYQKKIDLKPVFQPRTVPLNGDNINSWMSTNTTHESFLDFLNKLDDLENPQEHEDVITEIPTDRDDVPERDENGADFDEIATILEVLEQEDKKSQKNIESLKEIVNTELSDSKHTNNYESRNSSTSSLDSSTNYNEVLSYLDEVDQNCMKTLETAKDRVKSVTKVVNAVIKVDKEKIPKLEDLLNYSNVELAHYVVDLSLRYKEKSSCTSVLQAELAKLRNSLNIKLEEAEKSSKQKLKTLKDEYEAVIKRHQKFIDQLIADKKTLNSQCEGLISEMKVLEDRYNTNTRAAEQRHKIEMQKTKDMHMAAEKFRREKWIEGKTQKIKEMTVKSLEPELQNMTKRHEQDISDLRSLHKRELEDLELRAARKTQQQCETLRQQLTIERENAITHERDILRQRFEKLVESEETNYQEQRRRLNAEHSQRMTECEERITQLNTEKERAIEAIQTEFDDKLQTALRRQKTELKNIRETVELEFEVWKNNYKKQQAIKLTEMETQMRDLCKKDRDREIELVIERLEQEASDSKEQTEQAAENRLRRLKEKYDEEVIDLEKAVGEYKAKYSETKEKVLHQEDTIINLSTQLKQFQTQLHQAKEISDTYVIDKTILREQIRDEFITEIKLLENELKLLKSTKDEDLQKIFAKVKLTVARKDELLSELQRTNTNLQEKCVVLENLLEQQRKEYLIK